MAVRAARQPALASRAQAGSTRAGLLALGGLCLVYAALATLWAAPGSNLVLATAGGSPGWLLGPLRFAGIESLANGSLGGPLFYAGLWLALILYVVVLLRRRDLGARTVLWTIAGLHLLFLLAPPLLSQDVFSYIAYARLGVEHSLNPYTHSPSDIPLDAVYPFAGSKDASSVYGPVFTLLTYPLAPLGVPAAFWVLKVVAAAASFGVVLLVWRTAELLGRDPVLPAMIVGLNPHVVVHVTGGAHNEALMMFIAMLGVLAWVAGRRALGPALTAAGAGVKATSLLFTPYFALSQDGRPRPEARGAVLRAVLASALALGLIALVGLIGFGSHALDAVNVLSNNQGRTSRWSLPYKTAQLLGAVLPGDRLDYRDAVRSAYAAVFAGVALWLMWRTWRGADPIRMAGWATFAILVASAWLVPWYLLWLLPLAALARDRRLLIASIALSAWALVIAVPLGTFGYG
ncbi:MAG: polyprenol phosphomannose-dependent alpha 1,6 mannosyltransferase MptB [Thermoleophilaceae bacterium]